MITLTYNTYSTVWMEPDDMEWVYKRQHEFLTDNEYWCLCQMYPSGYVPEVVKLDRDLLKIKYIAPPTHSFYMMDGLMEHRAPILAALKEAGIRHGDLTEYAVLIGEKCHPYLIDFSESRLWDDPRPDKRPEGDGYWLAKALEWSMKVKYA